MRTVEVSIAGKVYEMPVNFAASMQIHEHVGDPLKIAFQMSSLKQMLSAAQIIGIIAAGVRSAGCELEQAQIGDEIIGAGVQNYLPTATTYIVELVAGSPAKPTTKSKKKVT